jgi:hypothetical protein
MCYVVNDRNVEISCLVRMRIRKKIGTLHVNGAESTFAPGWEGKQ